MAGLNAIAREGSRFLSAALLKAPALRPAATEFAASLHSALEASTPALERRMP
jgi:hypothetical protein